ncbi:uncharacterized protein LOC143227367 [Tachypleus tridentatus]|uniref:uncharacterized protein LOC143227367 n=1 Tax=Tachypleus tridentatus TaxID=6853 RepID=UPI003FCF2C92
MSAQLINKASTRLLYIRKDMPSVFARKPRSCEKLKYWKATELRQFLLHTRKFVLKGLSKYNLYDHFVVLSIAVSILVSPNLVQVHINYAAKLLTYFVKQAKCLYGPIFLVYNVHNLLHIADDARELGVLDAFSAFPFAQFVK